LGFTGTLASEPMLLIGQDVVPIKVTHNVAVDDVFKYFTSTGPDCIPSFILKSAADELAPILTHLYQYSLAEGEIPSDWRDAHIVPVFKKVSFMDGYLLCPLSGIVLVFSFVYTD
jgi:hypothetical protein